MEKFYNYYMKNLNKLSKKVNFIIGANMSLRCLFKPIKLVINVIIAKLLCSYRRKMKSKLSSIVFISFKKPLIIISYSNLFILFKSIKDP